MSLSLVPVMYLDPVMRRRSGGDIIHMERSRAVRLAARKEVRILSNESVTKGTRIMQDSPVIHTAIPFLPGCAVGAAYNQFMASIDGWALILDHDIYLVNPHWYTICRDAINRVGESCGWLTCFTNRIGCPLQVLPGVNTNSHDMMYHREVAKKIYNRNRGRLIDHTASKYFYSGMFILTNKKAWNAVKGFSEKGFFGIDVDYCRKLRKVGFKTMLMSDLYVYHGYMREVLKPFFTEE
jgi:hypothetical protein